MMTAKPSMVFDKRLVEAAKRHEAAVKEKKKAQRKVGSKGNKFKNKWDSYDVDAEADKVDREDSSSAPETPAAPKDKSGAVGAARSALEKELGAAHVALWGAQDGLDAIVLGPVADGEDDDDAELRAARKALVVGLAELMNSSELLQKRFLALRDYPKP